MLKIWEAIVEAIHGPLTDEETEALIKEYSLFTSGEKKHSPQQLLTLAKSHPAQVGAASKVVELLKTQIPPDQLRVLSWILFFMDTAFGSSLLFGTLSMTPFTSWTVKERANALFSLQSSSFAALRSLITSFSSLTHLAIYGGMTNDPHCVERQKLWDAIGYPGPDPDRPIIKNLIPPAFKTDIQTHYKVDVCIIGSGAGGGTVGKRSSSVILYSQCFGSGRL
jgi:hypothetical protein